MGTTTSERGDPRVRETQPRMPSMDTAKQFMTQRALLREETMSLARLSIPVTIINALELVPGLLTSIMIGQTAGDNARNVIAASGLSDFFQGILPFNIMTGLGAAVSTLCAQAYGADRHEQFWLLAQAGLLASVYSVVPITILSLCGAPILKLMGQDPALAVIAQKFILIGLVAYPFTAVFTVVRSAFQARNIAAPFVVVSLLSSALSLPVGYGLGNYTSMTYIGVSLSSILASVLKATTAIFIVITNYSFRHTWPGWRLREAHQLVCSFWRVGLGSVLMTIFQSGGFMTVGMLCGYLPNPSLAIAASSIGSGVIAFSFTPILSLASAGTVRIGNALGRGEPFRASLAAALTLLGSFAVAIFTMIFVAFVARPYAALYTHDTATITVAAKLTYYLLPLIPLVAITSSAQAVFQACNAQSVGAALNCTFLLVTSIGAGLVVGLSLHGGLHGLWSGQLIGTGGMIIASAVWVKRLDWQKQALEASESEKDRLAREDSLMDLIASPALGSAVSSVVFVLDQRSSTPCSAILGDDKAYIV